MSNAIGKAMLNEMISNFNEFTEDSYKRVANRINNAEQELNHIVDDAKKIQREVDEKATQVPKEIKKTMKQWTEHHQHTMELMAQNISGSLESSKNDAIHSIKIASDNFVISAKGKAQDELKNFGEDINKFLLNVQEECKKINDFYDKIGKLKTEVDRRINEFDECVKKELQGMAMKVLDGVAEYIGQNFWSIVKKILKYFFRRKPKQLNVKYDK